MMRSVMALILVGLLPVRGPLQSVPRVDTGVLPNQTKVEVRLEQTSAVLSPADVQIALTGAIAAWNAVLPAKLRLVATQNSAALPPGEAVILVRFDANPTHFGTSGVDELGDTRRVMNRPSNSVVIGVLLFDKRGSFTTNGAKDTSHDLQLILMHEFGHALGLEHEDNAATMPPIMAPALDDNAKVIGSGKSIASLRQVSPADRSLLDIAMLRRARRDISGSYVGSLAMQNGTTNRPQQFAAGDFVVTFDGGKVLLNYKGSKREAPAVDLLNVDFVVRFPAVADGRPLQTATIRRGNTPAEIDVEANLTAGGTAYRFQGTLTRK